MKKKKILSPTLKDYVCTKSCLIRGLIRRPFMNIDGVINECVNKFLCLYIFMEINNSYLGKLLGNFTHPTKFDFIEKKNEIKLFVY